MTLLHELFSTDVGLMSLGVIVFTLGMAVWFKRFFARKIAEAEQEAQRTARP